MKSQQIRDEPFDTNFYRLAQDTFSDTIRGYDYRSYIICPNDRDDLNPVTVSARALIIFFLGPPFPYSKRDGAMGRDNVNDSVSVSVVVVGCATGRSS